MLEMPSVRKNKITLSDYAYQEDIKHRLIMASFTGLDVEVLQEILFSPLRISLKKLLKNFDAEEEQILETLKKFSSIGLLTVDGDVVSVDKDMRKYYESQAVKFEEDFVPDMDFLQSLLKKVPIGILPLWYSIPRTSNNIFESLIEKYLSTPQTFQRYLLELDFPEKTLFRIFQDVYNAKDCKVHSSVLMEKYDLSREQFEEYLLLLEFNLVCCLGYEKIGGNWKEVVTPFHEWKEYLTFVKNTTPSPIEDPSSIIVSRLQDFSHISDLTAILQYAKKKPIPIKFHGKQVVEIDEEASKSLSSKIIDFASDEPFFLDHLSKLIAKLRMLKLAEVIDGHLYALDSANNWLDMKIENRALYLHRNDIGNFLTKQNSSYVASERNIREVEKSIQRALTSGWVYFDDFVKGVLVPLSEESTISLKKVGRSWKYTLPEYTSEEQSLIRATIFDWLFSLGIVQTGIHNEKECFRVTAFGQSFFGS